MQRLQIYCVPLVFRAVSADCSAQVILTTLACEDDTDSLVPQVINWSCERPLNPTLLDGS